MTLTFLLIVLGTMLAMLLGAGLLHTLPRLGPVGKRISESCCHALLLDVIVTYFLILPGVAGVILLGWWGIVAAVIGQVLGLQVWVALHEYAHAEAMRGPRIVKSLNRMVGAWRNHAALWVTAIVVPLFWLVRMAEIFIYPFLVWLVRLPRYKHGEWVNVSRHKFEGLVGHDLIWCLYCDWMTGVWSLGSEILRNVESFWCPIRFYDGKKCENCKIDFPDIEPGEGKTGWVAAEGKMAEVTELLEQQYEGRDSNTWFGHPARLTVEGKSVEMHENQK